MISYEDQERVLRRKQIGLGIVLVLEFVLLFAVGFVVEAIWGKAANGLLLAFIIFVPYYTIAFAVKAEIIDFD